jgi:sodium transport system permease protein
VNVRWANVWTIFRREVRDQVRDQRTLFMIFVLPLLLYPLIGLGAAKVAEIFATQVRTVVLVGADHLKAVETQSGWSGAASDIEQRVPPLLNADATRFNPALFDNPAEADQLAVEIQPEEPPWTDRAERRNLLRSGKADAVVLIPSTLAETLSKQARVEIPIAYNSADERSQLTFLRVNRALDRWNEQIRESRRKQAGKPEGFTEPVRSEAQDVARVEETGGAVWAKIFPFLLVLMALTGAFYPSVDLCAGEKERGTMETLLISPASRPEIVLGKFFTVMLASNVMALLNLASMGVTAWGLAKQLDVAPLAAGSARVGAGAARLLTAPSLASAGWMILLLIPLSAFFSAVCVALAVLARSMKEGQYYMTPLYMFALPLAFISLGPGVELNLFTSLLPVTGVSLLLRSLMQGDYDLARRFFLPVLVPIVIYGLVALRWAVDQYKSESVLFRAGERFDVVGWFRHLWRDKPAAPSPAQALLCFVLILVAAWFVMPWLGSSLLSIVAMQVLLILGIPCVLALALTSNPAGTLRLRLPRFPFVLLAMALPLALFPIVTEMNLWVERAFPTPEVVKQALVQLQALIPSVPVALLVFALVPAVCEETAFRGYILSGLSRSYRPAWAIVLSALLFGFLHVLLSLFNQLFNATLLGLILGVLALQSGSLLPGVLFHLLNNTLGVLAGEVASNERWRSLADALFRDRTRALFHTHWLVLGALVAIAMLLPLMLGRGWARRFPGPPSDVTEEEDGLAHFDATAKVAGQ